MLHLRQRRDPAAGDLQQGRYRARGRHARRDAPTPRARRCASSARKRPAPPTTGTRRSLPIKTLKDTEGKTIAFSTNGSSTNSVVLAFIKEFSLKAKPMATGNPSSTLTAVMTNQVDVGWASPPFGLKEMDEGQIRVVAQGDRRLDRQGPDHPRHRDQHRDAREAQGRAARFMHAYRETIDYMYSANPQVMKDYAEFDRMPEAMAKRVRDEFFPKALIYPDEIKGLDTLMPEAVSLKFIPEPLTKAQLGRADSNPPAGNRATWLCCLAPVSLKCSSGLRPTRAPRQGLRPQSLSARSGASPGWSPSTGMPLLCAAAASRSPNMASSPAPGSI